MKGNALTVELLDKNTQSSEITPNPLTSSEEVRDKCDRIPFC